MWAICTSRRRVGWRHRRGPRTCSPLQWTVRRERQGRLVPSERASIGAFLAIVALSALVAGCSAGTPSASRSTTSTTRVPLPAGSTPSPLATQICATQARQDIASSLGEAADISTPTWSPTQHLYACDYRYSTGSFTLSMKELSSWDQTYAYFDGLQAQLGKALELPNLGQGAFRTTDGSVVVRKDWKVLLVDSSHLPAQFGVPPTSSGDVAVTVADVILGCWAGD